MAWTPRSHDFHSLNLLHAKTYLYAVGFLVSEKIYFKSFFPIINLVEIYFAMATRVPIYSVQNPYATYAPT